MFRFKLGIAIGYGLGYLVTSGKAAELVEQVRERRSGAGANLSGSIAPAHRAKDDADSFDFALRAAE